MKVNSMMVVMAVAIVVHPDAAGSSVSHVLKKNPSAVKNSAASG